ncbi:MAG: copper resistance protein B [Sphingomicrobium sp.]
MTPLRIALLGAAALAFAVSTPAAGQMDHSNMPGMRMPAPVKKPAAKRPVAKKPATERPAARDASTPPKKRTAVPADPHTGHDMSTMPAQPAPAVDPHAGHDMSTMPVEPAPATDPHAGHDMGAMESGSPAGTDLPAGNSPPPTVPTDHAGDIVYGTDAMNMGRHHLNEFHGGQKLYQVIANIAEYQLRKGGDAYEWDAEGWYGGDINRLWVKSEGEGTVGGPLEKAEVQAFYSRAFDPYFNWQVGLRYDFKPDPSRVYAVVGIEGLAPSFFDVEGALFLSNKGELMARAEGYYDQRITQRLILQPRAELNFAAQNSREIGVGAGLSDAEIGVRLRYDIRREFAPYIGVQYRQAFGKTRRYLRDEGEDAAGWSLLAGIRMWL